MEGIIILRGGELPPVSPYSPLTGLFGLPPPAVATVLPTRARARDRWPAPGPAELDPTPMRGGAGRCCASFSVSFDASPGPGVSAGVAAAYFLSGLGFGGSAGFSRSRSGFGLTPGERGPSCGVNVLFS